MESCRWFSIDQLIFAVSIVIVSILIIVLKSTDMAEARANFQNNKKPKSDMNDWKKIIWLFFLIIIFILSV